MEGDAMRKLRIAGIAAVLTGLVGGVGLAPASADSGCANTPSFYAKEGQAFNLTSLGHPWGGSWNDKISSHDEAS
jgi:hypothetical protein